MTTKAAIITKTSTKRDQVTPRISTTALSLAMRNMKRKAMKAPAMAYLTTRRS